MNNLNEKKEERALLSFGSPASYGLATFIGLFGAFAFFPLAPLSMLLIDKSNGTKDSSGKRKWQIWSIFGVAGCIPLVLLTGAILPGSDPIEVATEDLVESVQEVVTPEPAETSQSQKLALTEKVASPAPVEMVETENRPYWESLSPELAKYVPAICEDISQNVDWTPSFYMNRQMDRVNDHVRALDLSPEDQRTLTYAGWGCITTTSRDGESAQEYGADVYKFNTKKATGFSL